MKKKKHTNDGKSRGISVDLKNCVICVGSIKKVESW